MSEPETEVAAPDTTNMDNTNNTSTNGKKDDVKELLSLLEKEMNSAGSFESEPEVTKSKSEEAELLVERQQQQEDKALEENESTTPEVMGTNGTTDDSPSISPVDYDDADVDPGNSDNTTTTPAAEAEAVADKLDPEPLDSKPEVEDKGVKIEPEEEELSPGAETQDEITSEVVPEVAINEDVGVGDNLTNEAASEASSNNNENGDIRKESGVANDIVLEMPEAKETDEKVNGQESSGSDESNDKEEVQTTDTGMETDIIADDGEKNDMSVPLKTLVAATTNEAATVEEPDQDHTEYSDHDAPPALIAEMNNECQEKDAVEAIHQTDDDKKDVPQTTSSPTNRSSLIGKVQTVRGASDGEDVEEDDTEEEAKEEAEDPWVIADSNLRDPQRRICVVTTAALPWRTGTAVNPLLRALYLTRGRPKHHVTLVIPWCPDEEDRNKTLGSEHSFSNQEEQEAWIREFCRTRAKCEEEEKNLKIQFYPANYNEGFGSIFPTVDICSLIPNDEADVAILEEPEHLNWLRIPKPYKETDEDADAKPETKTTKKVATSKEKAELGWRFKFRHVVGIIHTNYKAYAEQYGVGGKVITAPALSALNALVVRAYCHRVILLSGTLPSLTPYKEVTCNVHGVRGEFLDRPSAADQKTEKGEHAPVYFIGKLIWAKGFDKILDLENLYREKHDDYFPIDIYGAGGDEKAIKRAFFGRIPQIQRSDSSKSSDEEKASTPGSETAEVFTWETSLRSHLVDETPFKENEKHARLDDHMAQRQSSRSIVGQEAIQQSTEPPETPTKRGSIIEEIADKVVPISVIGDLAGKAFDTTRSTTGAAVAMAKNVVGAGLNVAFTNDVGSPGRQPQNGKKAASGSPEKPQKQKLIFDPPQSVFEFRRNPIQARFLGTKDHALIRDISEHKVFLNMSITEVLCTTSAEALAMGKFVILPKHPSNTFFLQFPNCLAYSSLEECVEKLEWALENEPKPLSEDSALKLSWEGATERLFESSAVTRDEWEEWEETGKLKSDTDAARFHVETGMKGQLIGKFFTRDKKPKEGSKTEA